MKAGTYVEQQRMDFGWQGCQLELAGFPNAGLVETV